MKNNKKLISILIAVCMVVMLGATVYATTDLETGNHPDIVDLTHLDVKGVAYYNAKLNGQDVRLKAAVDPSSIVVTVKGSSVNLNYTFANYAYLTLTEKGMTEYRIMLDANDGAALAMIRWDGVSFRMENVYVSARLIFNGEDVPAEIAAEMTDNGDGTYSINWSGKYTGIQECTGHNGLRSAGHHGLILGLDLFLGDVPGVSVNPPQPTDPVQPTEPEVTTAPEETTEPEETTVPEETTEPEETTVPEETTEPEETTVPEETTEPEETTVPEETTEPEETTVPEETTEPEETTVPEETTEPTEPEETTKPTEKPEETTEPSKPVEEDPSDDVPNTGDNSVAVLMALMTISAIGMAVTLVTGKFGR